MILAPEYHPAPRARDLGAEFYDVVAAAEFPAHVLRYRNQGWAARLGLGGMSDAEWVDAMAKFQPLPDNLAAPLAFRYHGHQFRSYNDELGDGRGFLYAQMLDPQDGRLLDLGTKGSGQTPYSRFGDGRLTLKGGVREILATAMLEALGVNTSKTFSLIETGESLHRNDEPSPTRSAVLVRLSHSHIRIGTFQRLSALGAEGDLVTLLDYVVANYMPDLAGLAGSARALGFLAEVQARVARTGAQWMVAGFVHGVLNTDNINVTGESFDYGPWRFIPTMDPAFTAAYFDRTGLYAYGAQADAISWNLARLAECLLPLVARDDLQGVLNRFPEVFRLAFQDELLRRLGLADPGDDAARDALSESLWRFLFESQAPFEQVVFDWYGGTLSAGRAGRSPCAAEYRGAGFAAVRAALERFVPVSPDLLGAAYFSRVAPCTMLIDEVEAIWDDIDAADDWSRFATKLADIGEMAAAYGVASPAAEAGPGAPGHRCGERTQRG